MAAEAYRLDVPEASSAPVAVWRGYRGAWHWRRGPVEGRQPSKRAAQSVAAAAVPPVGRKWRQCSTDEARSGLTEAPRSVHAVERPVERGPVERPPTTLREYLRILYGDVPTRALRYLEWIRTLPCCVCGLSGQSEAHHEPPKGMGGGHSGDFDAVPLCVECHRIRHGQETGESLTVEATAERSRLLLLPVYFAAEEAPARQPARRTVGGVELVADGDGWRSDRPVTPDEADAVREYVRAGRIDE